MNAALRRTLPQRDRGLTTSAAYSQAERQPLRDQCEALADDMRALSTLIHALRTELGGAGIVKRGA